MPTAADLERLQALLTRLTPLTTTQRGMLIRAEDWNTVVGAVIEVARTVLSESAADTVAPHDHADQVQLSWLDGRLRGLLTGGPLTDPPALARVADLERRLGRLDQRLAAVRDDLGQTRVQVADVSTRDLIREGDVTKVRRNVEAIGDARADVAGLRASLASVQADLGRAVEVGRQLEVGGAPLDIPALVSRVGDLEALRDRLTLPDGAMLDAAALENRLTELTNTLVTQAQLDDVLHEFRPPLAADERARITDEVAQAMQERLTAAVAGVRADTAALIDQRLAAVDDRVAAAVDERLPAVRDGVLATVDERIGAAVARSADDQRALLDQRLADTSAALTRSFEERARAVGDGVPAVVRAEVGARLDERLTPVNAAVARHDDTLAALDRRAGATADAQAAQAQALANVQSALNAFGQQLDRRVSQAVTDAAEQAQTLVDAASAQLRDDLTATLTATLTASLDDRVNALRGEAREIARDEVSVARADLEQLVTARISERFGTLADDVTAIVREDFHNDGPIRQILRAGGPGGGLAGGPGGGPLIPEAAPAKAPRKAAPKKAAPRKAAPKKAGPKKPP
jgi:hypothetical protein